MIAARIGKSFGLLFAISLALTACQMSGRLSGSSSGSASYHLFFDPADHVKELMAAGEFDKAAVVYQDQKAFFSTGKPEQKKLTDEIAAKLTSKHAPVALGAIDRLGTISVPPDPSQWNTVKNTLASADAALTDVTEHAILLEARYQPEYLPQLQSRRDRIGQQLSLAADSQFLAYIPSGQANFFDLYPVPIDAKQVLSRNRSAILTSLGTDSPRRLEAFASTYKSSVDGGFSRELGFQLYESYQKKESTEGRVGLPAILNAFTATRGAGLPLDGLPGTRVAVVEVSSETRLKDKQLEFPVGAELDIPLYSAKADFDSALDAPEARDADILILLDPATARNERTISNVKKVASEFKSGTRQVPNPDYNMAQNRVNQAEMDYRRAVLNSAQTNAGYCYGWGCLAKGIAQVANAAAEGMARSNVGRAMSALNATPMQIEEPVYKSYSYSQTEIDAAKEATINYLIIDRSVMTYSKDIFEVRQSQKFKVNYNIHEEDRNLDSASAGTNRESDVVKFEEAPIRVPLSQVLNQYQQRAQESRPLPPLADLRSDMLAEKNKILLTKKQTEFSAIPASIPESRLNSVVVVLAPGGNVGTGFYVKDDTVLTNYHVIEGTQFVEMKLRNGQETFGKVIAKDIRVDLALIKAQMRGEPAMFFSGQNLPLGETVLTIGHPKGLEFSVTRGIISGLREMGSTRMPGGKKILFVQTDAAINPGNSGGPLYLNDSVIGVNTQKLAATELQGLGFAIHYSEVLRFLGENGIEARKSGE